MVTIYGIFETMDRGKNNKWRNDIGLIEFDSSEIRKIKAFLK